MNIYKNENETSPMRDDVPKSAFDAERFRHSRVKALSAVEDLELVQGLNVLASAMNEISAPRGYGVTTIFRPLVSDEGNDKK